jgi:hypothetical protein
MSAGIAGAETNAQHAALRCSTCGTEMEHPRVVQAGWPRLRMWCSAECAVPDPRADLAEQMARWLRHLSYWTDLPDDAVLLEVRSPEATEAVRVTARMISAAAPRRTSGV